MVFNLLIYFLAAVECNLKRLHFVAKTESVEDSIEDVSIRVLNQFLLRPPHGMGITYCQGRLQISFIGGRGGGIFGWNCQHGSI